jgi:hypothetical protein
MRRSADRFRQGVTRVAGVALALALAWPAAATRADDRPAQKVKVFALVHRDASGFVDERNKDLEQTLNDVREAIVKKKNGWLQMVEAQEQADIVLEITERTLVERAPTAATTTTTYSKDGKTATSTTSNTPEHDVVLKAVMHVGSYSNELTGRCDLGYLFGGPYRQAAKNLVGSLENWVKSNHTRLQLKKLD